METQKQISVLELIKYGFVTVFEHLGLIAVATLVYWPVLLFFSGVVFNLFSYFVTVLQNNIGWVGVVLLGILTVFVVMLIGTGIFLGWVRILLDLYRTQSSGLSRLFSGFRYALTGAIAGLFYIFIVAGGLLLFIVPGIIWSIRFSLFSYFILEHNAGPIESLRLSYRTVKGYSWKIFTLWIIHVLVGVAISPVYMYQNQFMSNLFFPQKVALLTTVGTGYFTFAFMLYLVNVFIITPAFMLAYIKFYGERTGKPAQQ